MRAMADEKIQEGLKGLKAPREALADLQEQINSILGQGASRRRQFFEERLVPEWYRRGRGRERVTCGPARPVDYELLLGMSELHLEDEIWESFMFQNLLPAFDEVPMRRVFPICFHTKETWTVGFDALVRAVLLTSGCELVVEYPLLEGSGVYRGSLRTSKRHTRRQFENSQAQLAGRIVETLKQDKNVGSVTVNFNFGSATKEKEQKGEWSGKFKDFTEGIRNLILAGAGLVFIFDGTLMTSSQSGTPHQISITQIDRQAELQALPKILDATSPQDFREAIESLDVKKPQQPTTTRPAPGRKFRY